MRAIVTGAGGALAGGAAVALSQAGHRVVGLDLAAGRVGGVDVLACDVTDDDAVRLAVHEAVDRLGGLDLLLNGAGVAYVQDSGHMPDAAARAVLDVNLLGPWRTTAAALPALLEGDGPRPRVVTVASVLSQATGPFTASYCASKRGVTAWMDAVRHEYRADLDVVTVHPGYVRTPIHAPAAGLGLSLDGLLPADDEARTVAAIVRACTGRYRRDVPTSPAARATLALSRHTPRLAEAVSRRRMRTLAERGDVPDSGLSAGLVARVLGR